MTLVFLYLINLFKNYSVHVIEIEIKYKIIAIKFDINQDFSKKVLHDCNCKRIYYYITIIYIIQISILVKLMKINKIVKRILFFTVKHYEIVE